jgi:nicotinamide-nucleotide amidase
MNTRMRNGQVGSPGRIRAAILLLAAMAAHPGFSAPAPVQTAAVAGAEYVLILAGGELLDGSLADAHTPFVTRTLLPLGLRCVLVTMVDDIQEDMHAALRVATERARLVLVTGGLGPTVNDITREVLSDFTGIPLAEDPVVLAGLAHRFNQPLDQLREGIRRQSQVPQKGSYLPNRRGTAVGLIFDAAPATIVALPGPPRELQPMVEETLVPWLRERLGLQDRGCAVTLRFVGIGQSAIDAVMREHVPLPPRVVVGSQFEGMRVDMTFSLPEGTIEARQELAGLTLALQAHLGAHIYATNAATLEDVTLARLRELGDSWAIAESSGPHLAAALARAAVAPDATGPRLHSLAATSEPHLRHLLSLDDAHWDDLPDPRARAAALARSARRVSGAAWAVALGEPISDQTSRGLVWVCLSGPDDRSETWALGLRESPDTGWPGLVTEVLNRLRRLE